VRREEPGRDISKDDAQLGGGAAALAALKRAQSTLSHASSRSSVPAHPRAPVDPRSTSRTDMATGLRSVHRGFDFATEENGVAMRRMQTNLSEVRASSRSQVALDPAERKGRLRSVFSIGRNRRMARNLE
jgi:phospholipid-translocating ATPase